MKNLIVYDYSGTNWYESGWESLLSSGFKILTPSNPHYRAGVGMNSILINILERGIDKPLLLYSSSTADPEFQSMYDMEFKEMATSIKNLEMEFEKILIRNKTKKLDLGQFITNGSYTRTTEDEFINLALSYTSNELFQQRLVKKVIRL